VADAEKLAFDPAATVVLVGFWTTVGALDVTAKAAEVVVAEPLAFVKTARYRLPFWLAAAVKLSVADVAPAMMLKVTPPSELTCHCTAGAGTPVAVALKLAVDPAATVALTGLSAIAGGVDVTVSVAEPVLAEPLGLVKTAR
jgi:hypothetical protein